jgi:uncharacterized protein
MKKPHLGVLIKPAGFDCNMACSYCYYRPVQRLYPGVGHPRMSLDVFDAVCEQYATLQPVEMRVGWQGGEPTLMGLDFFREAVNVERQHARPGECFGNSLQTNGVALDDAWCRFLAANRFLVGLSVDGPAEVNGMRRFSNGRAAHRTAMGALALLKKHGVDFNVLVVISQANVARPRDVFRFLVENDCHYAQLIPCTEPAGGPGKVSEDSVTPGQYADFMIGVFDAWAENDDPSFYLRQVDNWLHQFFGLPPECCEYRGDCSNLITIEWNGDVYPCDFFVEERYRMGNVAEQTLERMMLGPAFRDFTSATRRLGPACRQCEWLSVCHGGCFRHRIKLGIGENEPPYLCEASRRIFSHVFGAMREIRERPVRPRLHAFLNRIAGELTAGLRRPQGLPASAVRRPGAVAPQIAPGRNDPCPCGSGRKFKACCGRRARALQRR